MAHWIGLVLAVIAVAFLITGWRRRQAVRAERVALGYAADDDTPQRRDPYSSIAILGDAMPPLIVAALVFVALKAVFFYVVLGGEIFTIVDLVGFLMLLGGYGAWMWWHSRYRFAEPEAAVAATPAGTAPAEGDPDPAPDRRHVA
ncbi:hypothetical protein [Rhodovibrio salinarum]|uniref:Uncharacterized protein n=1 Tax=Rhodovibrio salinarum TaxID=1087 RepID=A0A934QGI6_9PROT|nr:hypothetical protein [Rhodovibrio salinarum]MBK1696469.1 hypothetical protein [Rhodovibrio salinarum]